MQNHIVVPSIVYKIVMQQTTTSIIKKALSRAALSTLVCVTASFFILMISTTGSVAHANALYVGAEGVFENSGIETQAESAGMSRNDPGESLGLLKNDIKHKNGKSKAKIAKKKHVKKKYSKNKYSKNKSTKSRKAAKGKIAKQKSKKQAVGKRAKAKSGIKKSKKPRAVKHRGSKSRKPKASKHSKPKTKKPNAEKTHKPKKPKKKKPKAKKHASRKSKAVKKAMAKSRKERRKLIRSIGKAHGLGLKSFGCKYRFTSKAGKRLRRAINALAGRKFSFVMVDVKSGKGVSFCPNRLIYTASSIKAPYVAAICKFRPKSVFGRTKSTIAATIGYSSNEGYASLRNRFGSGIMGSMMAYSGVKASEMPQYRKYCSLSSKTLAKLWAGIYWTCFKDRNSHSAWLRTLYRCSINSFIKKALTKPAYTKYGWYDAGRSHAYNDAGIVLSKGHPYILAIMSSPPASQGGLCNLVKALDAVHTDMVSTKRHKRK